VEHLYISRKGDYEIIIDYKRLLEEKSIEELGAAYNREANCGIVGAHRQALYLIALRQEFIERLGESPIYVIDNMLIGLVGEIKLEGNSIKIIDKN